MAPQHRDWLTAATLAGLTFVVFYPALDGKFVNFDDYTYVSRNRYVTNGLSVKGAQWAFTTSQAANWHPLTWLSLQLDSSLWKNPTGVADPRGYHLTSVLLHAANAALVFLVFRSLTGAFWRSAVVALLFAVHPLRVESVAWIAERKDVLSALFGLLAIRAYAGYVLRPSWWRYLPVALALALSLMSKPMLVTLPCLLLVLDWWPLGRVAVKRDWWRLTVEKLPLFALAAASCVITYLVQEREGAVMALEETPLAARSANAAISYAVYLSKTFWPAGLAALYPHPGAAIPVALALGALALLVTLSAACVILRQQAPYLLTGWLWYLGTLVPVIGLVQVGIQARADRYTYFPQIGILMALCWGVARLLRSRAPAALGLGAVAAVALIVVTSIQITFWRDSLHLWERSLAVAGESATTYANLGETEEEAGHLEEATRYYEQSLRLAPKNVQGLVNLGSILKRQKKYDRAAELFKEIIRIAPESTIGYTDLALLYKDLKKFAEAAPLFEEACRHGSDLERSKAFINLGSFEEDRENFSRAVDCYGEALKLQPDSAQAYTGLGVALLRQGQNAEGLKSLQRALQIDPEFEKAHSLLGKALSVRGDLDGAAWHFEQAIRLNPKLDSAWYNLGLARGRQQRLLEAAECFAKSVECDPRPPASWRALDGTLELLRGIGQYDIANQIEQRVHRLRPRQPANAPAAPAP
jgi:tetratricopeptide (TPR) repeat protein